MTQIALPLGLRYCLPPYRASWIEAGQAVFVDVGERCVDESWSFYKPGWKP